LLIGFININNMSGCLLVGDEPLFTSLSLYAIDISECLVGLEKKGSSIVDYFPDYLLYKDFIDSGDIEAEIAD